ncbi:hypothetical protein REPUB_Repub20aG0048200 [Reevesia pubescens]
MFFLYSSDFGNENVELVQNVAALNFSKAVILGNHDSWSPQQFSSKKKDRVQLQLECGGGGFHQGGFGSRDEGDGILGGGGCRGGGVALELSLSKGGG